MDPRREAYRAADASAVREDRVIRLENFEGPLDLLLQLIDGQELDITEVSLAQVTDQYLGYLEAMQPLDLEDASEFAGVAARLLEIKAKTLLPPAAPERPGEDEDDPADDLVQRLLTYKQFKEAAELLRQHGEEAGHRYPRFPEDLSSLAQEVQLQGVSLQDLLKSMESVLAQARDDDPPSVAVTREMLSVDECMRRITWRLRRHGDRIDFVALFQQGATRLEIVVTFLALLELLRRRRVAVEQTIPTEPIKIVWRGNGNGDR